MIAGNRVNRAVGQASGNGGTVAFRAQRRRQLGKGPVIADGTFIEGEIGRRGVAGDSQALRLAAPDRLATVAISGFLWKRVTDRKSSRPAPSAGWRPSSFVLSTLTGCLLWTQTCGSAESSAPKCRFFELRP